MSETVKHLRYDMRVVRDGVGRGSNAGSSTSKTPQTLFSNSGKKLLKVVYGEVISKGFVISKKQFFHRLMNSTVTLFIV